MADDSYILPQTCGPMLRQIYSKLLQEPVPQQLKDLLAMLEEADTQAKAGTPSDAKTDAQPNGQPQTGEPRSDKLD